jgi:signal transduction histidine kinase
MIDTWLRGFSVDVAAIHEMFEPVSVSEVVDRALETVEPHAVRKGLDLAADAASGEVVLGDRGTLTEAVVNILGNAIKYSPDGGRVTVTTSRSGEEIAITISDQGIGIPPEDLPHVFDDFFRSRSVGGEGGAGIGLAISHRIVDAHGGAIRVDSEVGSGSTFVITLPAYDPAAADAAPVSESIPKGDTG